MKYTEYLEKVRGNRQENEFIRYQHVLDEAQIYELGVLLQGLKHQKIDYKKVKEIINLMGFKLDPILEKCKTQEQLKIQEEKLINEELTYKDIRGLLLTNEKYKNIIVNMDTPMMEVLAKYPNQEAEEYIENQRKIKTPIEMSHSKDSNFNRCIRLLSNTACQINWSQPKSNRLLGKKRQRTQSKLYYCTCKYFRSRF